MAEPTDRNGTPKPAFKKEPNIAKHQRFVQEALGMRLEFGQKDDPIVSKYPLVFWWLTNTDAGVKYRKTPATLKVAMVPGGCIVTLYDSDLSAGIDGQGPFLEQALADLEEKLDKEQPVWKLSSRKEPTRRKRKEEK